MMADQPGRHAEFPQITVVLSGMTSDLSKTNEEDASMVPSEGSQVDEQSGVVVHKDVAGVFSRRVVALENRIDRIEGEMQSLKSRFNGRLARIEDKQKALLKVQQEILSKLEELGRVRTSTSTVNSGLFAKLSSSANATSIIDRLALHQKRKRMRGEICSSTSSMVAREVRRRYRSPLKPNLHSKPSFVKYYKRMRAKSINIIAGSIPLDSSARGHSSGDIGTSSRTTSSEPQLDKAGKLQ